MLFGRKIEDLLLNAVEEVLTNFTYVKKISEDNLSKRNRYELLKHEIIEQLENVFVFDLKTNSDQEFAEAYAAAFLICLPDSWDRDLTPEEIQTERKNVVAFNKSCGNPFMEMFKYVSENYEGVERSYIDKEVDEIVNSYRILLLAHVASGFDS